MGDKNFGKNKRLKIAIHNPRVSYFLGGTEITIIEFCKILSLKYDVTLVTSLNKKTQNFKEFVRGNSSIKVKYFNCPEENEFLITDRLNGWDFEGICFGEETRDYYELTNFDLIICFYLGDIITLNKKDSKVVLHLQGYPNNEKILDRIAFSKVDFKICCSKHVSEKIYEKFGEKINNIYYSSPNLKEFTPKKIKRDIDILYLGRLTERKGADILIKSLKNFKKNYKCVIAGKGDMGEKLKNLIEEFNLQNNIKLIGAVQKEDTINLLNRSKIFVLPAKTKEPFSKAIIEAMCMGCTVISTPVGGIPEVMNDNYNGLLVESNNERKLTDSIEFLLSNEKELKRLSKNAKKDILIKFEKIKKEKEFLDLYDRIIGGINAKS